MITEQQRELRRKYLGSSDVAAIFGLSPWQTAEDVRLIKAGLADEPPGNVSTVAGDYLEPAVRHWAQDRLGKIVCPDTYIHLPGMMCANLDGELESDHSPVEVKTSGICGPIYGDWGSEGSSDVPPHYYVQVMCQIACSPHKPARAYLAALLGGRGFVMYQIERDDELIGEIEKRCMLFWKRHVIRGEPAPQSLASMDVLKRIKREPGLIASVASDVWADYYTRRQTKLDAQKAEELAQRHLLGLVGQADAISVDGEIKATYRPNKNGVRSFKVKENE